MGKRKIGDSQSPPPGSSDELDGEAQDYDVEVIVAVQVFADSETKYLVKWDGYTSEDDSWEPEDNLTSCEKLLSKLWKHIGKKRKNEVGIHEASDEWIKKQRERYRRHKKQEERRNNKEKLAVLSAQKAEKKLGKKARRKESVSSLELPSSESEAVSTSDEENEPLSTKIKKKSKVMTKTVTKRSHPLPMRNGLKSKAILQPANSGASTSTSTSTVQRPAKKYPSFKKIGDGQKANESLLQKSGAQAPAVQTVTKKLTVDTTMQQQLLTPTTNSVDSPLLPPRKTQGPPQPTPSAPQEAVDNFLATTGLSFGQVAAQKPGPSNTQSLRDSNATCSPIVPSRCAWTGELEYGTADRVETLCQVNMCDPITVASGTGFKLRTQLQAKSSLRFSKAYTPWEFKKIRASLRDVDEFARLSHKDEKDRDAFNAFVQYLETRNLVVTTAAINTYGHVAEFIIYPSSDDRTSDSLKIQRSHARQGLLFITLAGWLIPPSKYNPASLLTDEIRELRQTSDLEAFKVKYVSSKEFINPMVIFRSLGIDYEFMEFLPTRKCCIWANQEGVQSLHGINTRLLRTWDLKEESHRGGDGVQGLHTDRNDTKMLVTLLSILKAVEVKCNDREARVIFIHVGALRSLRKMPLIVEHRLRPDVIFYTYGSHECVKPSLWTPRQIFPSGGVITFTASALLGDLFEVETLIQKVFRHPRWMCYILPSALAIFIRLLSLYDSPISVHEREPETFGRILTMIDEGKVALCESPALLEQPLRDTDISKPEQWIEDQLNSMFKTPKDLVADAWDKFDRDFANKPEDEIHRLLEKEIVNDMTSLQMQPYVQDEYRRMVVIKSDKDTHIAFNRDGFEWRTALEFDFMDGFGSKKASVPSNASL